MQFHFCSVVWCECLMQTKILHQRVISYNLKSLNVASDPVTCKCRNSFWIHVNGENMLYLRFKKLIKEIKEICKLQRLIYLHIHGISSKFKIKADNITMNRKGNTINTFEAHSLFCSRWGLVLMKWQWEWINSTLLIR